MPLPPFQLSATNLLEYRQQGWHLFRDLYEERLAGCKLGDVFVIEGNKDLSFNYATTGCLETHLEGGAAATTYPNGGVTLNESGLRLSNVPQGAIKVSSGHYASTEEVSIVTYFQIHFACDYTSGSYVTSVGHGYLVYVWTGSQWVFHHRILDNGILPGGKYGFWTRTKRKDFYVGETLFLTITSSHAYITSSGEVYWIFLKKKRSTDFINAFYFSPDHPCFGNGNDPLLIQHPFGNIKDDEEIIAINPTEEQVKKLKHLCKSQKMGEREKSFEELIGKGKPFDIGKEEREYPKIPVTIGIVDDEDKRPLWHRETAKITKCVIPQPENVKVRNLEYN